MQNRIHATQLSYNEQQSQQLPNQIQYVKLLHENEVLKEKVSYLESELLGKVKLERDLKNDLTTQIHDKDARLRDATLNNEELKKKIAYLNV